MDTFYTNLMFLVFNQTEISHKYRMTKNSPEMISPIVLWCVHKGNKTLLSKGIILSKNTLENIMNTILVVNIILSKYLVFKVVEGIRIGKEKNVYESMVK